MSALPFHGAETLLHDHEVHETIQECPFQRRCTEAEEFVNDVP